MYKISVQEYRRNIYWESAFTLLRVLLFGFLLWFLHEFLLTYWNLFSANSAKRDINKSTFDTHCKNGTSLVSHEKCEKLHIDSEFSVLPMIYSVIVNLIEGISKASNITAVLTTSIGYLFVIFSVRYVVGKLWIIMQPS